MFETVYVLLDEDKKCKMLTLKVRWLMIRYQKWSDIKNLQQKADVKTAKCNTCVTSLLCQHGETNIEVVALMLCNCNLYKSASPGSLYTTLITCLFQQTKHELE